ncbi:TPA: hypothetical protein ACQ301_004405 [Yersinia enterocolitica]
MNKILISATQHTTLNEPTEFNETISKMLLEEKPIRTTLEKEDFDSSANDKEMVDIIIGYMVANNTIEIMRKHQELMKEIIDEE